MVVPPPPAAKSESAPPENKGPIPKVRRRGSIAGFGDTSIEFPSQGVELAERIVEYGGGGYLDLARSKDGRTLWSRRKWDEGSVNVNRFDLEPNGRSGLVLQFVDGNQEPLGNRPRRDNESYFKNAKGQVLHHHLDAWPVDPTEGRAFDPHSRKWLKLKAAGGPSTPAARRRVQWMARVEDCDAGAACVYFGPPPDVCGKYTASIPDPSNWAMWIGPTKCRGQW